MDLTILRLAEQLATPQRHQVRHARAASQLVGRRELQTPGYELRAGMPGKLHSQTITIQCWRQPAEERINQSPYDLEKQ